MLKQLNVLVSVICLTVIVLWGMELGTIDNASLMAFVAVVSGATGAGAASYRNGK